MHLEILFGSFYLIILRLLTWLIVKLFSKTVWYGNPSTLASLDCGLPNGIGGSQYSWLQLCGGAPQGTLLGVILFVVHISDLEFECQYSKYVDDTNIMHISSDPASASLQNDAVTAHTWSSQNDMIINATKTKELCIDFSKSMGPFSQLYIGNSPIEVVSQSKFLGVIISDDLKWSTSLAKPHSDYFNWCYAVELVSPQTKCYLCTQPKFDRYWDMRVPHGILA